MEYIPFIHLWKFSTILLLTIQQIQEGGGGIYCSDTLGLTTISHNLFYENKRYNNILNNAFETNTDTCQLDSSSTIFANPKFVDFTNKNYELLAPISPAIDTRLINAIYNDPEDPNLQGMALAPAFCEEELGSDLGAWGGRLYILDSDRDRIPDEEEVDTNPILSDTDGDNVLDAEKKL